MDQYKRKVSVIHIKTNLPFDPGMNLLIHPHSLVFIAI